MLTNSLRNVLVSHQSWWISRSDQTSSEDQESSYKKVNTKTLQEMQEITSQKQNGYFTHSILPLHHIVYSCLQFSSSVPESVCCVEGSCSPVRARTLPFQASSSCVVGQFFTFCCLWSRILLLLPFPFSFTPLLMEFEIQFSLWWTLTILGNATQPARRVTWHLKLAAFICKCIWQNLM